MNRHHPTIPLPRQRPLGSQAGFSLLEVLVVAGILAVLAAAGATTLRTSWQNERVTALANEFATWLEQVKATSMRSDAQCTVTISTGDINSGGILATVTPNAAGCVPTGLINTFQIPEMPAGRFNIAMITGSATAFTYTPRGATTNANPVEVTFAARGPSSQRLRCVQVSATLGQVRVGRANGTTSCITT
jgi:prepilin-type N-terminal cleavage/methylation domain-containing protein